VSNMSGSIENRGKGSWRLTVSLGVGAEGKYIRKRKTVKAKNKTAAKDLLAEFKTELRSGEYIDPTKIKFGQFVDEWRTKYAEHNLSSKTLEMYNYLLNGHILPAFKNKRLDSFLPMTITDYLQGLAKVRHDGKEGGLSTSTTQKHYNVLSSIFKFAKKNHLIKNDPVENAEKPIVRYKKSDVYTTDEIIQLYELLKHEPIERSLIIKLALDTGMRRGEILALTWDKVDFDDKTIHVQHSLSYTRKKGYEVKGTKTEYRRFVSVAGYLMKELKDYHHIKKKQKFQADELWDGGDNFFVFCGWDKKAGTFGKPFSPDGTSQWWDRFLNRTGFKRITFHDLRHSSATHLINQGVHPKVIAERLGHKDIKITMNTYGHYIKEADEKAANINDDIFGNIK